MTLDLALLSELLVLAAGCLVVRRHSRRFQEAEQTLLRRCAWFAVRPAARSLLLSSLVLAPSLVLSLVRGLPVPAIHDEFSYLLAADTFRQGRLTNPTHPLWIHFETIHVVHEPTYMSKYPPGQGLFLAAGWLVFGHPAAGAWFALVSAVLAIHWMLSRWLPPRWAVLGAILAALHSRILIEWGNTYWGGTVAMLGGALLFGGLRGVVDHERPTDAVLLAAGLILLTMTRPLEGALAALLPAFLILQKLTRLLRAGRVRRLLAIILPTAGALTLGIGFLLYYNFRVTGNPLRLPYQVHEATYGVAPLFLWQPPKSVPDYRHAEIRSYHADWSMRQYRQHFPVSNLISMYARKLEWLTLFFLRASLVVPIAVVLGSFRPRRTRFALMVVGIVLLGVFQVSFLFPHYVAPVIPLVVFLAIQGFRLMRTFARRQRGGFAPGQLMVVVLAAYLTGSLIDFVQSMSTQSQPWSRHRAQIQRELEAGGERHVVIVSYAAGHPVREEWVYNAADIDAAVVVWARDMGTAANKPLTDYFKDRRVWRLEVARAPFELQPYVDRPAAASR